MGNVKSACRVWLRGLPVAIPLTEERDSFIARVVQGDAKHPFIDVEAVISGDVRPGAIRASDVGFVEELPEVLTDELEVS